MEKCREKNGNEDTFYVLILKSLIAEKFGKFWRCVGQKERIREGEENKCPNPTGAL